jgi:DNA gyrase subunit A
VPGVENMAVEQDERIESGAVRPVNINDEMQAAYLDYAMSVIVARALPDVRDGLKPVHRRILYAMYDMGLTHDKPYKKSARIVGEVLGKYHPHGDAAVYEAMARMAQDFSMRAPLIDGQGNFGSIDGDAPAAMRYTEARLAPLSDEMLRDIEKATVDFGPNFDGTLSEPLVLPALLPNLLVNGASGIAVGMATNIPPHNLGEVCDALIYLIGRAGHWQEVNGTELMKFIPGPDFPTGGIVFRYTGGNIETRNDALEAMYAQGRGRFVVQAKAYIEEMSRGRSRIVVTELPYAVNKARLIERIADLVRDGRLEGITDVRDESDRTGMRLTIELTRNVNPQEVLERLFKLTPMRMVFGASMLALVDGEPRTLSLKRLLLHYLEHRQEVVRRRSEYDLAKARERAHILEGLLIALSYLDEVIQIIRRSQTTDSARNNLVRRFKLTEIQASAILEMPLKRLAQLERKRLEEEYHEKQRLIKELESLLACPERILAVIKQELEGLKERYADRRRTQILDRVEGVVMARDLLPDETVWVFLTADGRIGRRPITPDSKLEGTALAIAAGGLTALLRTNTQHDIILVTATGRAGRLPVYQIPAGEGGPWDDLTGIGRQERVVAAIPISPAEATEAACLFLATRQGKAKRLFLSEVSGALASTPTIIGLNNDDEVIAALQTPGDGEVLMVTRQGKAIRFREADVRPMGLPAGGVGALKLGEDDAVVACVLVQEEDCLITVTEEGYTKRVPLSDFPAQGRYGSGVIAAKVSQTSGPLISAAVASGKTSLLLLLAGGGSQVIAASRIPISARHAQGNRLSRIAKTAQVVGLIALPMEGDVVSVDTGPPPSAPPEKAGGKRASRRGETEDAMAGAKEAPRKRPALKARAAPALEEESVQKPDRAAPKPPPSGKAVSAKTEAPAPAPAKRRARRDTSPSQPKIKRGQAKVLQVDKPEVEMEEGRRPKVRRGQGKAIPLTITPPEAIEKPRRRKKGG